MDWGAKIKAVMVYLDMLTCIAVPNVPSDLPSAVGLPSLSTEVHTDRHLSETLA